MTTRIDQNASVARVASQNRWLWVALNHDNFALIIAHQIAVFVIQLHHICHEVSNRSEAAAHARFEKLDQHQDRNFSCPVDAKSNDRLSSTNAT
ncbi:hypothetical protein, partial [uncultured Tateyamaria sp.]|uniref:hypothetical protein n=1 Tax=uncultured Tateyamaria sp. TaxID=455651 RepID=UPI00260F36DF